MTPKIMAEMDTAITSARRAGDLIHIYAEAETIRRANLAENIALEDIVEGLMIRCACGALATDWEIDPYEALEALLGDRGSAAVPSGTMH